jgi:hypothetical protein
MDLAMDGQMHFHPHIYFIFTLAAKIIYSLSAQSKHQ